MIYIILPECFTVMKDPNKMEYFFETKYWKPALSLGRVQQRSILGQTEDCLHEHLCFLRTSSIFPNKTDFGIPETI